MSRYEKFDYYHKNYLNSDIDSKTLNKLDKEFKRLVVDDVIEANEIEGAVDFLKKNHSKNKLYVNSATPEDEISEIIIRKGWEKFFTNIYGSPKSKLDNIKIILATEKKPLSELIFFGDAKSDFLAARAAEIDFVLLNTSTKKLSFSKEVIYSIKNFNELLK